MVVLARADLLSTTDGFRSIVSYWSLRANCIITGTNRMSPYKKLMSLDAIDPRSTSDRYRLCSLPAWLVAYCTGSAETSPKEIV
jgi:hypothetical protein